MVERYSESVQNVFGESVKQAAVFAAVDDGGVVVEAENHAGQQGKNDVFEADRFAAKGFQVPDGVVREGGPRVLERRPISVSFPDEDVDVSREGVPLSGVEVEGRVQVEEVAKMVVHVDC